MEFNKLKFSKPNLRPQISDGFESQMGGVEKKQESFLKKSQEIIVGILKNNSSEYGNLLSQFTLEEFQNDLDLDIITTEDIEEELKNNPGSDLNSLDSRLNSELSFFGRSYISSLYDDFKKNGQIDSESFPFSLPPELFFIRYSTILDRTEQRKKTQEFWARSGSQNEYASWQKAGQEIISKLTEYWSSF